MSDDRAPVAIGGPSTTDQAIAALYAARKGLEASIAVTEAQIAGIDAAIVRLQGTDGTRRTAPELHCPRCRSLRVLAAGTMGSDEGPEPYVCDVCTHTFFWDPVRGSAIEEPAAAGAEG